MNVAKILKDKPKGTKLYSSVIGSVSFLRLKDLDESHPIKLSCGEYTKEGKYFDCLEGECTLFPSKEMRDWKKFAWKKGTLLENNDNTFCIFDEFTDDTYTTFKARYPKHYDCEHEASFSYPDGVIFETEDYSDNRKASMKTYKEYLDKIEETTNMIYDLSEGIFITLKESAPEKKSKHEFKPFDKVLVRDHDDEEWSASIFSHNQGSVYICAGLAWLQCLPYNEKTAKLLGTTKSLENIK